MATIVQASAWYLVDEYCKKNPESELNDWLNTGKVIMSNELIEYGHTYDPETDLYLESTTEVKEWLEKIE